MFSAEYLHTGVRTRLDPVVAVKSKSITRVVPDGARTYPQPSHQSPWSLLARFLESTRATRCYPVEFGRTR